MALEIWNIFYNLLIFEIYWLTQAYESINIG